jgi:hypothetical protein
MSSDPTVDRPTDPPDRPGAATVTGAVGADGPDELAGVGGSERRRSFLFHSIAVVGIVAATAFGLHEVHHRPALEVSDARVRPSGTSVIVHVTVHNRGGQRLCPTVVIAARNRDGLDITKSQAEAVDGQGRVDPRGTAGFNATFPQPTGRKFESFDKFVGYVESSHRC